MAKNQSLSLRTQWLGERLKTARVAAGLTLADAAAQLHLTDTSLSRFEKGYVRIRRPYVKEMIDFYGVSNHRERDVLLRLNDDSWRKDWWDGNASDLEMGFLDHTWLESRAARICQFAPMLIPGLVQTAEYAEAMAIEGFGTDASAEAVAQTVELRTHRQKAITGDSPTALSIVMEDAAIRRRIGGQDIYRLQLQHLLDVHESPHIDIRILQVTGWHPGLAGPFTYFEMPDPYPHVAYIENIAGRTFVEDESNVARFRHTYDELCTTALTPRKSIEFIKNLLETTP